MQSTQAPTLSQTPSRSLSLALPAFAAALFLSALLLFSVQPMFTKMALPQLGGSPGVWSVAMVFFQGLLLLGYLWAHFLASRLPLWLAAALHLSICALVFLALPIVAASMPPPPAEGQAFWLIGLFGLSVGLPFFALSVNGPLLQAWFARTGHAQSSDPYFLYGASNLGSFAALIAYPFVIEPLFGLSAQSGIWTFGFAALALALCACAAIALAARPRFDAPHASGRVLAKPEVAPARADYASWIALAFVPSGLLVAVTAHISTDVGAAPLLWVAPLALYLLTFVITFRDKPMKLDAPASRTHVWLVGIALMGIGTGSRWIFLGLVVSLAVFFICALANHRALFLRRPSAGHLTAFYVCMSFGGVLGGLFAALVAPLLFPSLYEYPALLVLSLLCRPGAWEALRTAPRSETLRIAGICALALVAAFLFGGWTPAPKGIATGLAIAFAAGAMLLWRDLPKAATLAAFAALSGTFLHAALAQQDVRRSFFGVHKIFETPDNQFRLLVHGTTIHGAMRVRDPQGEPVSGRPAPTTYYAFDGPLGQAISSVRAARGGQVSHIAAIGLGVGSLACHVKPGEAITFYEIDPVVIDIARDASLFRYLSDCAPGAATVLGDARLTIAGQKEASDVVVVDAFTSDAIPAHLMTREAVALFRARAKEDGVVLFHVSNNVMDFSGVLARIAADLGLVALRNSDRVSRPDHPDMRTPSDVVALVRDPAHMGADALASGDWRPISADQSQRVWSDDYSTILTPMFAKLKLRW
ncbi:MAG: fused MFS/spermidine synthase [Beijerinckiaceae bacterium]|nr:fused MFS/spermidine synthase [Beijerinckiaceae bacterium]